jgi:DNA-binding CsgD family transcriptional regulator
MKQTVGTVRCPLLIGRDDLLDLVDRRVDDVAAGRGQLLLVAGEAGVGKSRFLGAVGHKAEERGFDASWGFVAPQDHDVPAASVLDMARTMLRQPRFEELGRDLLALRAQTFDVEQVTRRGLVMDVVDRILAAIDRPTLLCFDDLQWADDLSLEIIGELARRSRDRHVLICGGYRTDEALPGTSLRDWRSRLLTQRIAEEVRLTPLSPADTALVTTLILDTGLPAPREVAAAVYERTDGIPLHIEELLGALSDDARANGLAIREARVPDTIEDAVLSRLSHRSPEAQAVARAGAIVGRCFVPEVLAGIMDLPAEAIEGPIQELIDQFVFDAPQSRGLIDFRHQLIRDAIYRSVSVGDRRRYHARAGEFGAQLEGQSEIHSSLHFERAGLGQRAFETALAGARDAARLSAHREAFELYRRAVQHFPKALAPADRATILEAYANEALAIEHNEIAEDAAESAAALFAEAGDSVRAVGVRGVTFNAWARAGRPLSERIAAIGEAVATLEALPEGPQRDDAIALINIYRAIAEIDRGRADAARRSIDTSLQIFGKSGDQDGVHNSVFRRASVDVFEGIIEDGLEAMARTAADARNLGEESAGVSGYRDAAMWAARSMRYREAKAYLGEGLRYADDIQQSFCGHLMQATSAVIAWASADWDDSAVQARQALSDRGCRQGANIARSAIGFVALGRGDLETAETELQEALAFGEQAELFAYQLPPLWGLAEAALLAGEPERAIARCDQALDLATTSGERLLLIPFVVTGVRAIIAAGRPDAAGRWLEACTAHLHPVAETAEPALAHARGLIALSEGSTGVARSALEDAVVGWDRIGRVWESSWARLDLAACHIRANRFADAVPLAADVRTTASRLDSRPLADRADVLLRRARGRVAVDEPWRPLTVREFAVARLIASGHTNAEIADSLGIAPKTASSHVEHILTKLGASRRAEIASWASTVDRAAVAH